MSELFLTKAELISIALLLQDVKINVAEVLEKTLDNEMIKKDNLVAYFNMLFDKEEAKIEAILNEDERKLIQNIWRLKHE